MSNSFTIDKLTNRNTLLDSLYLSTMERLLHMLLCSTVYSLNPSNKFYAFGRFISPKLLAVLNKGTLFNHFL